MLTQSADIVSRELEIIDDFSVFDDWMDKYSYLIDTFITKGLIALLIRVLSGQPAPSIVAANLDFLDEIGLRKHLSANRSNGLTAMIAKMKSHAAALGDENQ